MVSLQNHLPPSMGPLLGEAPSSFTERDRSCLHGSGRLLGPGHPAEPRCSLRALASKVQVLAPPILCSNSYHPPVSTEEQAGVPGKEPDQTTALPPGKPRSRP